MKHSLLRLAFGLLIMTALSSHAWLKVGAVYCDGNTNRVIDPGDPPVQSLLVVVTNLSGSYSNSSWTSADGIFVIQLPDGPDTFIDFIHPLSLPTGTSEVLPAYSTFVTSATDTIVTNFFLIENPQCISPPPGPQKIGHVFCDANTNGLIDAADIPVPGVVVVVTNASGTFSNAVSTDAHGFFAMELPAGADLYGDFIFSLPAGTTIVIPAGAYQFSIPTPYPSNIVTNDFLVQNPACISGPTPGRCWLTAGGTIKNGRGRPVFTFGGAVNPGCNPNAAGGGNFNVVWHAGKLHFKATDITVTGCGNLPGIPTGSRSPRTPFNYIDFEGVGTLKGVAGNHANFGAVQFTARAVDAGEPGRRDRLYLRVTDGTGQTLLLISGNNGNPDDVAPKNISTGNLQLHVSGCIR